jgi:hypothetical protein
MVGRISTLGAALLAALSGSLLVAGCGDDTSAETQAFEEGQEAIQANTVSNFRKLALCPPQTKYLVCGRDGVTYSDVCAAGGAINIAHNGACADYVCNGVVCDPGFSCRTVGGNDVPPACTAD